MQQLLLVTTTLVATWSMTISIRAASPEDTTRVAIRKAIPLIENASAGSADQRTCFTCHSQAMPILALSEATQRGFEIDETNYQRQLKHTKDHLDRGKANYQKGKGQGGQVLTAGYALWALDSANHTSDETTAAVTHYLLQRQKDDERWHQRSRRPPTSGSDFTTTYVALRALEKFGTDQQEQAIKARREQVGQWLAKTEAKDNEDRVFRLWLIPYLPIEEPTLEQATQDLLKQQRDDGGWAQNAELESDAYATATAMVALMQAGGLSVDHQAVQQGVQYLVKTQQEDGSWRVATRAKGFQTYFETGFPHGKDQFLSHAASSWAAIALVLTLPEPNATTADKVQSTENGTPSTE